MMNSISNEMGAEFFLFLQPTMGISEAQTPKDKTSKNYKIYNEGSKFYYDQIKEHYKQFKEYCAILDFCYDISEIATTDEEVYFDYRHHNEKGNTIISDEIYKIIFD